MRHRSQVEFWPSADAAEFAVGIAQTFSRHPSSPSHSPWGLLGPLEDGSGEAWLLFAPDGAPLHAGPDRPLPALIRNDGDLTALETDPDTLLSLNGRPLGAGACVQLLRNDRLVLSNERGRWELEVLGS